MRQCAGRSDLPITSEDMPQEWEFADDVDFADEEREPLDSLLQTACTQLRVWNLIVNESKTEFMHIYLTNASEADDQGAATRGNETWCKQEVIGIYAVQFHRHHAPLCAW